MVSRSYQWAIVFKVVFWTSLASAGLLSVPEGSDLPHHLKADSLSYDDATKTYRARGNVTITRADRSLQADAVDFNEETMEVEAWGDVRFFLDQDWLTGSRIVANLDAGTGTAYNATLFISQSNSYIRGDEIQKTGKDSYYVKGVGRFTTCDGEWPDWEITGRDLKVTIDGYGTVWHAAFWAKSVPVLYSPYFVFPAKVTRQSGLLVPQMSYSEVDGYRYSQPFFWAISDSTDATFYEDYMEHRGGKHGLEYRYMLAPGSKGVVMYDYLMDRQIDDGSPRPEDPDEYHYEGFRGDSYDRFNRDRWWFRMKSDQNLPAGFKAKLDVDLVSDQDYLREFDIGYSNYEDTDTYFSEEFGRELDDLTDTTRLNKLNVNRGWNQYSLNADIRWYDNVIMREHFEDDTTRQSLPSVTFDGSKQRIFDSPLYFDLKTSYDRYWREVGTRGYRVDLYPRMYYPVSLFKYFDFEPSAGLRGTYWREEEHHSGDPSVQVDSGAREIYDFKADLSTEISRVFNVGGDRVDRIKHSIRPQVVYDYVPKWQRRELPDFVSSVSTNELVTYSITNNFTARLREQPRPAPETQLESEEESLPPKFSYREFCRIKLSQSYDIIEARQRDKRGGPKPFSDVKGELEFKPHEHLDLKGDVTWSSYDSVYKSYNAILSLSDDRGDRAMVDYRYASTGRRSVLYEFFVELFGGLSGYWEHERNMWDGKDIRSEVGFKYESQCWSFAVSYSHEMTMHRREYFFQIELYGLGEVGLGRYRPEESPSWKRMG